MKLKKDLKNIYIDVNLQLSTEIFLEKDVQNRLKKVMRFKKGWQFAVFNGKDGLFLAEILDSDCQTVKLVEKLKDQPEKSNKVLFLPVLKKEALSNAVRQTTELGIDVIQPVMTEFTVEKDFKYDRYQQMALGAAEQSERLTLVEFKPMLKLEEAISAFENKVFWACERLDKVPAEKVNFTNFDGVLIGPEGGFSSAEKDFLFAQEKIIPQTLGTQILKADTAVVASVFKFNELKKAAMFGLDARIALAIFGALSIISGAALYSAIQSAKAEQWRQYFENIIKASEQYYLDNGQPLPIDSAANGSLLSGNLLHNHASLSNWNGPYLQGTSNSQSIIRDSMTSQVHADAYSRAYLQQKSDWAAIPNDFNVDEKCVVNNSDCLEWVSLATGNASAIPNLKEIFKLLDKLVDNADGETKGKVRYNSEGNDWIMYQGILRQQKS